MNKKSLKTLEYNKIIEKLVNLASSKLGKQMCENLLPSNNIDEIKLSQRETSDALARIFAKGSISFSGIKDIRSSIMRLEIGSNLSIIELLNISSLLDVTLKVKSFSKSDKEENEDSLDARFSILEPLTSINNEIKRCIISEEEIADDASSELKSIRRSIRITNDKIHEQLNSIVNSQNNRLMLQDAIITMRNGRYCIPVKQEYKSNFQGMVHDQSSSGSTFFIEPMAIVKLNNDLKELAIKEQEAIEKILAQLSEIVAQETESLKCNLSVLTELDFIFAKASLAKQMKATEPIFNNSRIINIKKGRHPLIDVKSVVPIDINLGKDFDLLIITGPNTGGKTVSLKTVGLFTLMGQAGLHIPAFDKSELAIFDEVYADIGDEQSIEQSLSTFSSHMKNNINIINSASENSLVLFDELGAGTDPTEGAALAMSILSYFHNRGIRTMATTHYSELKVFALTTDGVENACCEFSVENLRPTYRLLIGIPGKSNAFAISSKLGLPNFIIDDAKLLIDKEEKDFEDLISDLEQKRNAIEQEHLELTELKNEIKELKKHLQSKNEKIDLTKERIIRKANEEAQKILNDAKIYADDVIRKYNRYSKQANLSKEMERERTALRDKLNTVESKLIIKNHTKKKQNKRHSIKDFNIGIPVHVLTLNVDGSVVSLPNNKGDLYVQIGALTSQVNIKDLEILDKPIDEPIKTKTGAGKIKMNKSINISPEINIIGKTVDEAMPDVIKYLDDAYLSHIPQVTIIHGRGTGALKNAVHAQLKKISYVDSFRIGGFGEGDHGVTIVTFK